VNDNYAHAVEDQLKADAAAGIDEPASLAEMDRRLNNRPGMVSKPTGTLSKRRKQHPEQFKGEQTVAWLERLRNSRAAPQTRPGRGRVRTDQRV
jgi:hypothetical protein